MDLSKLIKKTEDQIKYFIDIIKELNKFQDKKVTNTVRTDLKNFLNGLNKEIFIRKDINKMITLRLIGMPDELAEVITINSINNKIYINCDRLWKNLEGLNEQIQELKETQREL